MTPRLRKAIYLLLAAGVLLFAYLVLDNLTDRVSRAEARQESAEQERQGTEADLRQYANAVDKLADQVTRRGGDPVVQPGELPNLTGGQPGPAGVPGLPGTRGITGQQGRAGKTGGTGATGRTGAPGAEGADGQPGADGEPGATGPQGETGATGPQGPQGPQGERGNAGPQGPSGTAQPGTYSCGEGQYVAGFVITGDGSVILDCRDALLGGAP